METVAASSEENSASVEEVSATAEELSAQVEEVSAASEEMASLADALGQAVSSFRLVEGAWIAWSAMREPPSLRSRPATGQTSRSAVPLRLTA